MQIKNRQEAGFTLVELAIVLVIIGLIVGGVLVGQDLIKAAEIRAVVTDLEKINAAANTFRTKYNGVPGDLLANRATDFGLTTGGAATDGLGDGDGVLENGPTGGVKENVGGETALFWRHLSEAELIPQGFNTATGAANATAADVGAVSLLLPSTRLRESAFTHAYGLSGRNYFHIGTFSAIAGGAPTLADGMSPREAENVDQKMDDGNPRSGIVRAVTGLWTAATNTEDTGNNTPAADVCTELTDNVYSTTDPDFLDSLSCQMRIRASF